MDAGDDSFLLNLAGEEEAQPAPRDRRKKKSLWERRQEHRQKASVSASPMVPNKRLPGRCMPHTQRPSDLLQGGRQQRRPAGPDVRPPLQKQPAALSALKGYSLEPAPTHAEPETASLPLRKPAAQQHVQQTQPARRAARGHAANGEHVPSASAQEPGQNPQLQHGNGVFGKSIQWLEIATAGCSADCDLLGLMSSDTTNATDAEDGPQGVESGEEDDVMEAVAVSRQRDEGLEALLARMGSHKEAAPLSSDDDEVHACA